jgi:hypothetical protein
MIRPDPLLEPDWDEDNISHIAAHGLSAAPKMRKLPQVIRKSLQQEATEWDSSIQAESAHELQELLDKAEPFAAVRPPRQPLSLRLDAFDLAMLKRIARRKGIPHTQLMAMWLHERIEQEKADSGG